MSLLPDYFVVSKQCPELYEVLKRIFDSPRNNIRVVSGEINYSREKKIKIS